MALINQACFWRYSGVICALLSAVLVTGCGGGSENATADPAHVLLSGPGSPGTGQDLLISEVATNYYSDDIAWFEVHNPSASPISLANYILYSSYLDSSTRTSSYAPAAFTLPAVEVAPGGHLVVAAMTFGTLRANAQMVYVRNGNLVPFWNGSGSLELRREGTTVDFVRFGSSAAAPETSSAWRGAGLPALPSGPKEHGRSIVRLASTGMPDTNSAADWALVNFATPAGINDVGPGVIDSDLDGIPDSAKQPGGTYAGLDLYGMGARAGRRDIFVEIDYMKGADPALTPRSEALQKVVDAFALRGIGLHLDVGSLYGTDFNRGGGNAVEFAPCVEMLTSGGDAREGCTSFFDFKATHFDVRRNLAVHYALFANSLKPDGSAGPSGVAELNGNDLVVALGGYGFTTAPGNSLNMLVSLQASTLMHELGHNLGLRHGGNEETNYKPNHYSVMNYMYQFAGLSATPDSAFAAERYYLVNGLKSKTYCNLVENSPCGSDFRINFSDGSGAALDENALFEAANIGRGAIGGAFADWDNNSAFTQQKMARNLNPQEGSSRTTLKDFDEWSNLAIPFSRGRAGNNYGDSLNTVASIDDEADQPRANPMNQRSRKRIEERPLPFALQDSLREMREAYGQMKHHDKKHQEHSNHE